MRTAQGPSRTAGGFEGTLGFRLGPWHRRVHGKPVPGARQTVDAPLDIEMIVRWAAFLPIIVCSIFGLAITLAKWRQFRRPLLPDDSTLAMLRRHIEVEDFEAATELGTNDTRHGSRRVAVAARCASRPRENVKEQVVLVGAQLAADVEYGLGGLSLLTTLGPLLGLLGTVVGIVVVFNRLAVSGGVATAQQLAGGIGTALFTTIAGICVGILALVCHRYLSSKAERRIAELEAFGLFAVDLVKSDDG